MTQLANEGKLLFSCWKCRHWTEHYFKSYRVQGKVSVHLNELIYELHTDTHINIKQQSVHIEHSLAVVLMKDDTSRQGMAATAESMSIIV